MSVVMRAAVRQLLPVCEGGSQVKEVPLAAVFTAHKESDSTRVFCLVLDDGVLDTVECECYRHDGYHHYPLLFTIKRFLST